MNKVYGFEGECKAKLGELTYKLFGDVFTMCKFKGRTSGENSKESWC